jgi:hypothetical protein
VAQQELLMTAVAARRILTVHATPPFRQRHRSRYETFSERLLSEELLLVGVQQRCSQTPIFEMYSSYSAAISWNVSPAGQTSITKRHERGAIHAE